MSAAILDAVRRFEGLRVLVVGDLMLDRYLHGETTRIAQEAPVPVVALNDCREYPGGAANVAANARALGAEVTLLGQVADDEHGNRLRHLLEVQGIKVHTTRAGQTLTKTRVCASDQVLLRYDSGGREDLDGAGIARLAGSLRSSWPSADIVVISDYAYGTLADGLLPVITELRAAHPVLLAVDARDLLRYAFLQPDIVKPDANQAFKLASAQTPREHRAETVRDLAPIILSRAGAKTACITLDCDGALVCTETGCIEHVPAGARAGLAFPNGAGDTFLTAFAMATSCGLTPGAAAEVASAAAAVVVRTPGTAACTSQALTRALAPRTSKVLTPVGLAALAAAARRDGRRLVFTNGVFDILHSGHTEYLAEAAALGDLLIVGLNDDEGVRRLKGPDRPVNPLRDRAAVLASLACVHAVVPFAEDTPERLIRIARPDVYVKGGDYTPERLPETKLVESLGGRVVIAGYVPGRSTTALIAQTRQLLPAEPLARAAVPGSPR